MEWKHEFRITERPVGPPMSDDLVLVLLRGIRDDISAIKGDMAEVKERLGAVGGLLCLSVPAGWIAWEATWSRIKVRLELVDEADMATRRARRELMPRDAGRHRIERHSGPRRDTVLEEIAASTKTILAGGDQGRTSATCKERKPVRLPLADGPDARRVWRAARRRGARFSLDLTLPGDLKCTF